MNSRNTFHSGAYEYLSRVVIKYVSFFVFHMEQDGYLEALIRRHSEVQENCFLHLFDTHYHDKLRHQTTGKPDERFAITQFTTYSFEIPEIFSFLPFSRHLHSLILSIKSTFNESLEQGGDVIEQMRERYDAVLPAHLRPLDGEDTFNEYFANFPCLMEYEISTKAKGNNSTPSIIMQFLKMELSRQEGRRCLSDLYVHYWRQEQLIRDIGKILEAVPLIDSDELFATIGDTGDLSRALLETILTLVMPT